MIVIKNVYGGSQVYIKNVFANAENLVVVYNGGDPIEITGGGGGSGDVVGPASATDNAIARFNLTTGKLIQNSVATIDDLGNITATNLSGTNTGDQDLSGKSNVGHTHVKANITDFADADYAPALGTDDNYVTDAEKTKLANLSGTNTGDQDLSGKQDTLVSGTNIKTINSTSLLGAGDLSVGAAWGGITGALSSQTDLQNELNDKDLSINLKIYNAFGATTLYESMGFNRMLATVNTILVDARAYYVAVYITKATTITGAQVYVATQGNFTGDAVNAIALYSYNHGTLTLTKVAETANDANIWKATSNTVKTVAFTSPYSAAEGVYFIGYLYNNSAQTTAPIIKSYGAFASGFNNGASGGLTANSTTNFIVSAQSTLPATQIISISGYSANADWLALY